MALVTVKRERATTAAWVRDDTDEIYRLQARENELLAAIAVQPARMAQEIVRKVQAWALVHNVNLEDIRLHGPSDDLPEPACTEIVASLLADAE